ncbi:hypothetical protein [Lentzea sp. NPDC059081]|uniref:hypothetical protein n=1 Tax=Lentzea sp. NPDC059081 TaxID=3346719 RepID=UPI0036C6698D
MKTTRSIPRSPGVNAGAVVQEAAQSRREVRCALSPAIPFGARRMLLARRSPVAVTLVTGVRPAFGRRARPMPPPHGRRPFVLGLSASAIAPLSGRSKCTDELDASSSCCSGEYEPESNGGGPATNGIAPLFAVPPTGRMSTGNMTTRTAEERS